MTTHLFSSRIGINPKTALVSVILIVDVFVWYSYASTVLKGMVDNIPFTSNEISLFYVVTLCSAVVSVLAGATWARELARRNSFLPLWTLMGIGTSIAFMFINVNTIVNASILTLLIGISFGLGLPASLAYFADSTKEENRARFGAIILLIMFSGSFVFTLIGVSDIKVNSLILASCRGLGLIAFLLVGKSKEQKRQYPNLSIASILKERSLMLYLIPWTMFALVNYLSWPIGEKIYGVTLVSSFSLIENIISGVFAIIAGFVSDSLGRKRTLLFGFIMFGLGYALLGIYPSNLLVWYFYTVVDGVAWGVIYVLFWFTIWGDLAHGRESEKYYALGILPYSLSGFLRVTAGYFIAKNISEYAIFSFAAFFLFVAVIPLMYAPETLPEKSIRDRELKQYVDKAKKAKEKYA